MDKLTTLSASFTLLSLNILLKNRYQKTENHTMSNGYEKIDTETKMLHFLIGK